MKKIFLSFLLLVSFAITTSASVYEDDKTKEEIKIESSTINNDRTLKLVTCFIDRTEQELELCFESVGSPVISIIDINGNVYFSQFFNFLENQVIISLPPDEGMYYIIINSHSYYGVGTFYML